jgi:hypothetical protein
LARGAACLPTDPLVGLLPAIFSAFIPGHCPA